ncbi:hypothetical protein BD310DRAFT_939261 [Dichomitus squalens]|uniref:Secreted protein n=1 Tax=Dichomitus squalens TaxID=114155 RepID=A0A4Q9PDX2_9APHY|nr:hypothetical protein BD310DRAFT_939261 [Dichomitus squalens]
MSSLSVSLILYSACGTGSWTTVTHGAAPTSRARQPPARVSAQVAAGEHFGCLRDHRGLASPRGTSPKARRNAGPQRERTYLCGGLLVTLARGSSIRIPRMSSC